MFLEQLTLTNFKNYKEAKVDFDTQIISLTGKNGMGKTNLLDAIYYLSFTKSAVNGYDQQNIRFGQLFFVTRGKFLRQEEVHWLQCSYEENGGKKFLVDKNPLEKLSTHIGEFPVVMVSPNDTDLVREWSELRRKFFDGLICQLDKQYLESLIRYNHFLKQRNALLKSSTRERPPDGQLLDNYDYELVTAGNALWTKRKSFLDDFNPIFIDRYKALSVNELVKIRYISDYDRKDAAVIKASQEHHLAEIKAAEAKLHDKSIVLIDDCKLSGGGKGRLAIDYLCSRGWKILVNSYQVILIKT